MRNFADRLLGLIDELGNPSCGGLDPRPDDIPKSIKQQAMEELNVSPGDRNEDALKATCRAIELFNRSIIDATLDILPAYKLQLAFYESFKDPGIKAFDKTVHYIQSKGRIAIADAKRNDIGDTAQAYADAYLGVVDLITGVSVPSFNVDALTVNPYPGSDGIEPFVEACSRFGKGIFILDKTSNASSSELQDLKLGDNHSGRKLYEQVALISELQSRKVMGSSGYSSIGVVVGANYPEQGQRIRKLVPYSIILGPGYGAQGATAQDLVVLFNKDGYGALINNSRALSFAYKDEPYRSKFGENQFAEAAREASIAMRDDILQALHKRG